MHLHISRSVDVQKGLMGGDKGATFTLGVRLEVDETEAALIDRFRLVDHPLTSKVFNGVEIADHAVGQLQAGMSSYYGSLEELMAQEDALVRGLTQLEQLLRFGEDFDEERSVDFSNDSMFS